MAQPLPTSVEVVTYDVGFGDCFLLRFHYAAGRPRHVLIDFGSTKKSNWSLGQVSQEIKKDCSNQADGKSKLDVVVATHRHKDHVHGYALSEKGRGTGKIIRELEPSAVILPWTEDPRAQPDALRPTRKYGAAGLGLVRQLANMQALAGALALQGAGHRLAEEKELRRQLRALGENNLGNAEAMRNLREMAPRTYYAYHGMKLRLARELPGVQIHVLGPPTLEQTKTIEKQRSRDADEFWHLQAVTATSAIEAPPIFPAAREVRNLVQGRWLRRQLRKARGEQLLSIVRSLDHAMNNTSLILLFEVGDKKLLFPGDAQYENWMYALQQDWVTELLGGVDVYKVGHHGSLNATPKSMLNLFRKTRSKGGPDIMHSLLSTLHGVHGNTDRRTEVPRDKLVKKLNHETQLLTTEQFDGKISKLIRLAL